MYLGTRFGIDEHPGGNATSGDCPDDNGVAISAAQPKAIRAAYCFDGKHAFR